MKKMFFLAALSAIALTSCVNDESYNNEGPQLALSFDAPAMKQTRANVKGEITGVHYNADEDFTIFCKYYKGNFTSWDATEGDYFKPEGDVATNEGNASKYWATAATYYWPDIEYNLAFAAYSPAVFGTAPEDIEHNAKGLQIKGFQTEADANAQYDLMYSDRVIDRNKTNNGSSAVPVVFNHALSSIVFSSEEEDESVNYEITDLKLTGDFIQKADFNQNIDEASVNKKAGVAKWENPATAAAASYEPDFGTKVSVTTVPTQFTQNESALLLIPQRIPANAIVTVVYNKIVNPGTTEEKVMENTVEIPLSVFAQENGNQITEWEMGKRYVYRIAFGQNKRIYFEPTTTDWVQEPTLIHVIQ